MSRNLIENMTTLFAKLVAHAAESGQPVEDRIRYIQSNTGDQERATGLKTSKTLFIDSHRIVVEIVDQTDTYYAFTGFRESQYNFPLPARLMKFDSAFLLPVLCDTPVQPTASPLETLEILDGPEPDGSYTGHAPLAIASLFPDIEVWRLEDGCTPGGFNAVCLAVSAQEGASSSRWISERLSKQLIRVATSLDLSFPFEELARATFDYDPRHMYLAIYKCFEAIYAHDVTNRVIDQLSLNTTWEQLASAFYDAASWHPREEISLVGLLEYADNDDLQAIYEALNPAAGDLPASDSWANRAGRAIYRTRNRIAHYSSQGEAVHFDDYDWNEVCALLAELALTVRGKALNIQHEGVD